MKSALKDEERILQLEQDARRLKRELAEVQDNRLYWANSYLNLEAEVKRNCPKNWKKIVKGGPRG